MKCHNCQKTIDVDSIFCNHCGVKNVENTLKTLIEVDKELLEHLEFIGYELQEMDPNGQSKRYLGKHDTKSNLIFNPVGELGVSFFSFWNLNQEKVLNNLAESYEMVNKMNNKAIITTFSIVDANDGLLCSALFLGKYNKHVFADFIDLLEINNYICSENIKNNFRSSF